MSTPKLFLEPAPVIGRDGDRAPLGSLDRELVRAQFERVSSDLLRNATVTDFVPVLVRRHVREALRSIPAAGSA